MPATAAFQAGLESTFTNMSYADEAVWGMAPATTFQAMRLLSETLAHKKTRQRPAEIRGDRQAAPAVTMQEQAGGSISLPAYFAAVNGTAVTAASPLDDWLSSLLGNDWQPFTQVAGVGGDISLASGAPATLTSATAGKFAGILLHQVVKLSGFANPGNNGFYRVAGVVSAQSLQLAPLGGFAVTTEAPAGAAAKIGFSNLRNGLQVKSKFVQQRLDPLGAKWLRYPGCWPTKGSLSAQVGQFLQASFDLVVQQELKGLADASTGGIVAAPGTRAMDPVGGFKGIFWNDGAVQAVADQFSLDIMNDQSALQFGLGSAAAQGFTAGTCTGSGKMQHYFRDFTYYDLFRAETAGVLAARMGDAAGNSYVVTVPNATLMNPSIDASGPNKGLMAAFDVEASPSTDGSNITVSIDRFPAGF